MTTAVRAITLYQPWASAMALGLKLNETRSWPTKYRGDLVICSAKRPLTGLDHEQELVNEILACDSGQLPLGCALCVMHLSSVVPTGAYHLTVPLGISAREARWGDYSPGRFAWVTRDLRRLRFPVPIVGRQGLFTLPPAAVAAIKDQL